MKTSKTPNLPAAQPMAEQQIQPAAAPPALDANGFDPGQFDWLPVPRARRADGWVPTKQQAFIEALADTASVTEAARLVGMSITSCYRLRRAPGAEGFAAAWDAAIEQSTKRLLDVALDRAINGVEEPILDHSGTVVQFRRRYNDRLLMFLLRGHHSGHYSPRQLPAKSPQHIENKQNISEAIESLVPALPANPQNYMDQDAFEDLLFNINAVNNPIIT